MHVSHLYSIPPLNKFILGINASINQSDRIKAIDVARRSFDHGIQLTHDREIAAGADVALCKHLALLLYRAQSEEMERERHVAAAAAAASTKKEGSRTATPDPALPDTSDGLVEEIGLRAKSWRPSIAALPMQSRHPLPSLGLSYFPWQSR